MVLNRMAQGMKHLRARLEQSAGVVCEEIRRGGVVLFQAIPVVPVAYSKFVLQEEDTPNSARVHAWLISTDRVPEELQEGDVLKIAGKLYRLQKDEKTEQVWAYHGEHEYSRAYFSVLWGSE